MLCYMYLVVQVVRRFQVGNRISVVGNERMAGLIEICSGLFWLISSLCLNLGRGEGGGRGSHEWSIVCACLVLGLCWSTHEYLGSGSGMDAEHAFMLTVMQPTQNVMLERFKEQDGSE